MSRQKHGEQTPLSTDIFNLDAEGRGIGRVDGKVVFVEGALPGERVRFRRLKGGSHFDQGELVEVLRASALRTTPPCPHFGYCGGCSMQHLEPSGQVAAKQRILEDSLQRIGKVRPEQILPPIAGPSLGYRSRARLSVRRPRNKGVLVGFHEKRSSFVADMQHCPVLDPRVGRLLLPLRALITALSQPERIPQIEVATTQELAALVFRHLEPFTEADLARLRAFAEEHGVQIFGQPGGPRTVAPIHPLEAPPLAYRLPEFRLEFRFKPTSFIQINQAINGVMVRRAMNLLEVRPGERILDLFCGLGNFSLPIARLGAEVLGVEGEAELVALAAENARHNGLEQRARFMAADLVKLEEGDVRAWGRFDKILIDPPRTGAMEIIKLLPALGARRLVYVSCNPATLARDAELLVHKQGYRLRAAGIFNMFPHTAHVESVALFTRD
ncbi:MAG: 23S rRNA (uracil(1939)-C(5))-methyltransferase RlmD [Pseudomonadota bacterium]